MKHRSSTQMTAALSLMVALAAAFVIWLSLSWWVGCISNDYLCWGSIPLGAEETRSAIVRNIGFAVLGVMGAVLGVWRTVIAHVEALALRESADAAQQQLEVSTRQMEVAVRQAELATQASEAAAAQQQTTALADRERRLERAEQQLGSPSLERRKEGIVALRELFADDHDAYLQIQLILTLFIRDASQGLNEEGGEGDSVCPDDIHEALLGVSLLRNRVDSSVEDAANWRPNLTGGWFRRMSGSARPLNLRGAEASTGNFEGANLRRCNFQGADLTLCDFSGARISRGEFSEVAARSATFRGAAMLASNLRGAYLVESDLREAELGGANFAGADLTSANLEGAILEHDYHGNADFTGANLTDARFSADARAYFARAHIEPIGALFGGEHYQRQEQVLPQSSKPLEQAN